MENDDLKLTPQEESVKTSVDSMIIKQDIYPDTGIITKRNFNQYGQVESVQIQNETHTVFKNRIVLNQIPSSYYRVSIEGLQESITNQKLQKNQFRVVYESGIVYFHPSFEGKEITISEYYGCGVEMIPTSRIYIGTNSSGNITNTLYDMIKVGTDSIVALEEVGGVLKDGKDTADRLEKDTTNATNIDNKIVEDTTTANNTNNTLTSTIQTGEATNSTLNETINNADKTIQTANAINTNLESNIQTANNNISTLQSDNQTASQLHSELTDNISQVPNLISSLGSTITNAKNENSELTNTVSQANTMNNTLTNQISTAERLTGDMLTPNSSPILTKNWSWANGASLRFLDGSNNSLASILAQNNVISMKNDTTNLPIWNYSCTNDSNNMNPLEFKVPLLINDSSNNSTQIKGNSILMNGQEVVFIDSNNNLNLGNTNLASTIVPTLLNITNGSQGLYLNGASVVSLDSSNRLCLNGSGSTSNGVSLGDTYNIGNFDNFGVYKIQGADVLYLDVNNNVCINSANKLSNGKELGHTYNDGDFDNSGSYKMKGATVVSLDNNNNLCLNSADKTTNGTPLGYTYNNGDFNNFGTFKIQGARVLYLDSNNNVCINSNDNLTNGNALGTTNVTGNFAVGGSIDIGQGFSLTQNSQTILSSAGSITLNPDNNFSGVDLNGLVQINGKPTYSLVKAIPSNTDLNTLTQTGFYYVNDNSTASSLANCPNGIAGILEVYNTGDGQNANSIGFIYQRWTTTLNIQATNSTETVGTYIRTYYGYQSTQTTGSPWSPWKPVFTNNYANGGYAIKLNALGRSISELALQNNQLKQQNMGLGKQVVNLSLENEKIKQENEGLGKQVVNLSLENGEMKQQIKTLAQTIIKQQLQSGGK